VWLADQGEPEAAGGRRFYVSPVRRRPGGVARAPLTMLEHMAAAQAAAASTANPAASASSSSSLVLQRLLATGFAGVHGSLAWGGGGTGGLVIGGGTSEARARGAAAVFTSLSRNSSSRFSFANAGLTAPVLTSNPLAVVVPAASAAACTGEHKAGSA